MPNRQQHTRFLAGLMALLIAPAGWAQLAVYQQDFDGLEAADPDALGLAGDGWRIFGAVFDGDPGNPPDGNFKFQYGAFSAPNGGPAFSAIAEGEGQAGAGDQYINVYSDYNCCGPGVTDEGHFDQSAPFDRVQSTVFQEQTIGAEDIGTTWYLSFDAKQPSSDGCSTTATSNCIAFFKTLDPNAGFATTNFITFDASTVSSGAWSNHVIQIDLTDTALEGQLLQFGFETVSEQFGNTGVYYDNLSFSMEPPPMEEVPIGDVTGVVDISGDTVPDIAQLRGTGQPKVRYFSGASRNKIKAVGYLSAAWNGIAIATVVDSNSDGVGNDPSVAVLGRKPTNGKVGVEVRRSDDGSLINKIFFLGANWNIIDVAVIDDRNGDGVTGDTAIAVLGVNPDKPFDEQIRVQVRKLSDGGLLANRHFLNGNWAALALEAVNRTGASPLLAVLANKAATGANVVQARQLSDGSVQRDTSFLDSSWIARDVSILMDSNGDGNVDDPAYLVLANDSNHRNKVQARRVSDGARLKNVTMLGTNWNGSRVTSAGDISGNLYEEVSALAEKRTDGTIAIQLKDFDDRTTTATIFP